MLISIRKIGYKGRTASKAPNGKIIIYLETDNWDDFGYVTAFRVIVLDDSGLNVPGNVKILHAEKSDTDASDFTMSYIPDQANALSRDNFASLGQSSDYYIWFQKHEYGNQILNALADLTVSTENHERWMGYRAFGKSLVRFSDAAKAFTEAHSFLSGARGAPQDFSFSYQTILLGADKPHSFEFNFNTDDKPFHRVNVIIGPNGVGKSSILHKLAEDLSKGELETRLFPTDNDARFSRQILVSTSPFDISKRPPVDGKSSYRFVGLRWAFENTIREIQKLTPDEEWKDWLLSRFQSKSDLLDLLSADFLPSLRHLEALRGNKQNWLEVLDGIINRDLLDKLRESPSETFKSLSAGQQSIVTILAGLSSEMDYESLILIDEPENHLHPQYLTKFYYALWKLMEQRNSFAIIATHSTLVLQEIPTSAVHILTREGNTPALSSPAIQCLGASLPTLALDVFGVDAQKAFWIDSLETMLEDGAGLEKIFEKFDPSLEPEVETYLRSFKGIK